MSEKYCAALTKYSPEETQGGYELYKAERAYICRITGSACVARKIVTEPRRGGTDEAYIPTLDIGIIYRCPLVQATTELQTEIIVKLAVKKKMERICNLENQLQKLKGETK